MKTLIVIALLTCTLIAQERMLLHIGPDGRQEAIPLKKGEQVKDVIEQREGRRAFERTADMTWIDTLKHYPSAAQLTTNFGMNYQDVVLQWYSIPAGQGVVKEIWWRNYQLQGVSKKGTIRAWYIDPRVEQLPANPPSRFLGSYKDPIEGGVQPFKPQAGNRWFYSNGSADSVIYSFDPFVKESNWLWEGLQVNLDSNVWQGFNLIDWGDSMKVKAGELFGFTLSNDSKSSGGSPTSDIRMEILAWPNTTGAPYHSFKFYEIGRTGAADAGWHVRGEYEWGMYVVVEMMSPPHAKISVGTYGTTVHTGPRQITATIWGDTPGGIASSYLFTKRGVQARYDSVVMTNIGSSYMAYTPTVAGGDTVYWYVGATELNGDRISTPARSYVIFKKSKRSLFIYNNQGFSKNNAMFLYTGVKGTQWFDFWSSSSDGILELPALMALYSEFLIVDGNFPAKNIYTAMKSRFAAATSSNTVEMVFSSQDYGCFIEANCADTTFASGSMELDYFGISKIGTQDLPPTNRPFKIVPQADYVTNYLIRQNTDSGTTLWYHPTYELGFAGYQDAMTFRAEAKPLFNNAAGTLNMGGKYITEKTRALFLGFDFAGLQFRSDTSLTPANDPKYRPITSACPIAISFFHTLDVFDNPCDLYTSVKEDEQSSPYSFHLHNNFPNPFNPSTTIEYSVPVRTDVEIVIYNSIGQQISVIVHAQKEPGNYRTEWDASHLPSGLYFYEMRAQNYSSVKKMLLLK
jgi:hypothetical protein